MATMAAKTEQQQSRQSRQSIFDKALETELQTYTMTLLQKVQDRFNIPLADLTNILLTGHCQHTECKCKALRGGMYCRVHTRKLQKAVELEYIELEGKAYLYDPHTRSVYSYGKKKPVVIGVLSDDLTHIVV